MSEPEQIHRRATDSDRDVAMEALFRVERHEIDCAKFREEVRDEFKELRARQESDTRKLLTGIIAVLLSVLGTILSHAIH